MDEKPMKTVKERMLEQKLRRRRRRRRILAAFLAVIAVVVLFVALINSPLFAVKSIEVKNTGVRVSTTTIENASGIHTGDLLWRVDTPKAEMSIYDIPWITSVTVKRKFPNRVVISVTEGEIAAYVAFSDGQMAIDEMLKTIAVYSPEERNNDYPLITGITSAMPPAGKPVTASEEQWALMAQFLEKKEALKKVNIIDLTDSKQVDLILFSGMTVKLGDCENLGYKLSALDEILKQMSDATGILDMRTNDGKVTYRRPEPEPEPVPEEEVATEEVAPESEEGATNDMAA